MTTDARSVILAVKGHAAAAERHQMTPRDLAEALAVPTGNTAGLWTAAATEQPPDAAAPDLEFDGEVRAVLKEALRVALLQRAGHVGTEHLLAALVHTGPPDVVAWLAARGATGDAVDALLTGLAGGPGVEQLPAEPSRSEQRKWREATERAHGGHQPMSPFLTAAIVVVVVAVLFVLCVWGP